jgi:hypothetical protein
MRVDRAGRINFATRTSVRVDLISRAGNVVCAIESTLEGNTGMLGIGPQDDQIGCSNMTINKDAQARCCADAVLIGRSFNVTAI